MTQPLQRKIADVSQLAQTVRGLQADGKTVVQCHGCFDLVHPGHVRYLQFARQLGDVLIVSLTGDSLMSKGPDRPYIPQELRAENLAALEFVDWVVIDPHPTACELLERIRPNVYVKGREYAVSQDARFLQEKQIVEQYGGRVIFHSGDVIFSSTRLIQSVEQDAHLDEVRLRTLCRRSRIDLPALRAALDAMMDVPVVVVGDVFRERYVFCDANGAAGDAPVLSLQQIGAADHWGGAAALALQLAALGARPTLIACTAPECCGPDDEAVRGTVAEQLADSGVASVLLPLRGDLPQRTTFLADDSKLFRVHEGACCPLDSAGQRAMLESIQDCGAASRAVLFIDHGYGAISPGLLTAATPRLQRAGVLLAGSATVPRSDLDALVNLDLVTTTERRLREARHDMATGLPAVVWRLLSDTHGRNAIVSLHKRGLIGFGGDGSMTETRRIFEITEYAPHRGPHASEPGRRSPDAPLGRLRSDYVPSFARHYADLAGTDEAVMAIATLSLATGRDLPTATYLASAAESLAAARPGRSHVSLAELRSWIETRPELRPECRFLPDAASITDIARIAPPLAAVGG